MFFDREKLTEHCERIGHFSALKAIMVLEALSYSSDHVSIADISEITGLPASTTHRILQELVDAGYASKDSERKYRLGLDAMAMGMRMKASNFLFEAAQSEMRRLNDVSGETVHLVTLDRYQGIYIGKMEAKNQIGLKSRVGWNLPLYCTGTGKAILAHHPEEWLRDYFKFELRRRFTEYTLTEEADIRQELALIREQGYSLDKREHNNDVVCIAAPVFSSSGKVVCSIGISAPDYRFSIEKALSFKEEVMESAKAVSLKLKQV